MESVPLRYGPEIPPMKCFKDLLSHWADIEKPTAGRKAPYYATRKREINKNAPRIAHEIHELMQTNEYHAECLQDTLNLKHFTWQKCQKAAQTMKHHTAPGASGISIDMLLLLPKEGWQTIALIFKTIIRTGIYPDIFKVGIITLLEKSQTSHGTLSNIRPITVLESTYRLFTNMVSKRVTTLFYKYDIVPKEQHACLLGRGSAIPIMQMNAAMEHAIDQHKIPEELDEMKYKTKQMEAWQEVTTTTVHKNGNHTI